jgi:hypothetical protein
MFGVKPPEFKVTPQDDGTVIVSAPCVFTKEAHSVRVNAEKYEHYISNKQTAMIQDVFPMESADTREFLTSGISPKGWTQAFGEE